MHPKRRYRHENSQAIPKASGESSSVSYHMRKDLDDVRTYSRSGDRQLRTDNDLSPRTSALQGGIDVCSNAIPSIRQLETNDAGRWDGLVVYHGL